MSSQVQVLAYKMFWANGGLMLAESTSRKAHATRWPEALEWLSAENEHVCRVLWDLDQDIAPLLDKLGLSQWLQVVVTSQETGITKPAPEIFLQAVKRAGVQPQEAIYVGDQYQIDVVGASRVGMRGVLIDRSDYYTGADEYPRIQSLEQVTAYLD